MEKILLFGANYHAEYTIDVIEAQNKYKIVGIVDFAREKGSVYEGYEILGSDSELPEIMKNMA